MAKAKGAKLDDPSAKYKRLAAVTLPTFKMADGQPYYFKFAGKIHPGDGANLKGKVDEKGDPKQPPDVAQVIDIETGEMGMIVLGKILVSDLRNMYDADGYVGKCFEITKLEPKPGTRAKTYSVFEIAEPTGK